MDKYLHQLFEAQVSVEVDVTGQIVIEPLSLSPLKVSPLDVLAADDTAYDELFLEWKQRRRDELLAGAAHILELHDNRQLFLGLQQAFAEGSLLPFVGAGLSRPSGFPLWSEFLDKVGDEVGGNADFAQLMQNGQYEDAVQVLVAVRGELWLWSKILHDYQSFTTEDIVGAVNYLPQLFAHGVFTTNFDNVLEKCYLAQERSFGEVCTRSSLLPVPKMMEAGDNFLYKLHGTFDDGKSRVFTKSEYETAYADASFVETLRHLFTTKNVLFLGCSLGTDRTMQVLEDLALSGIHFGPHYAFLSRPKQDWRRRDKETFLAQRGINVIWYDSDHDECLQALFEKLGPNEMESTSG